MKPTDRMIDAISTAIIALESSGWKVTTISWAGGDGTHALYMIPLGFQAGQIVVSLKSGELWQLECEIEGKAWGVSNSTGDSVLDYGTFRSATAEEAVKFEPSLLYQNRHKDSRAGNAVKIAAESKSAEQPQRVELPPHANFDKSGHY